MTAYAAAERGEIPTIRIGRLLRVPVRAMERLLDRKITHVGTYGRPFKPQRFLVAEPPQT